MNRGFATICSATFSLRSMSPAGFPPALLAD